MSDSVDPNEDFLRKVEEANTADPWYPEEELEPSEPTQNEACDSDASVLKKHGPQGINARAPIYPWANRPKPSEGELATPEVDYLDDDDALDVDLDE